MGEVLSFGANTTVGVLMIVAAILFTVLDKLRGLKWSKYVVLPLVFTGTAGLAGVSIAGWSVGRLIHMLFNAINSLLTGIGVPWIGWLIPVVLGLISVGFLIHDGIAGDIRKRSLWAAVGTPFTAAAIPGTVGTFFVWLLGVPTAILLGIFHGLFGV